MTDLIHVTVVYIIKLHGMFVAMVMLAKAAYTLGTCRTHVARCSYVVFERQFIHL